MKSIIVLLGLSLLIAVIFVNCTKNELEFNQNKLLGTWISLDKSDTLYITTKNDLYKTVGSFNYDHFDYQLYIDSIEIGYRGILYLLVKPTKHKYQFEGDNLIIDFSNKNCYGFKNEIITYKKDN